MTTQYKTLSLPVSSTYYNGRLDYGHQDLESDQLRRFFSGEDENIFGIAIVRLPVSRQMVYYRTVCLITALQCFLIAAATTAALYVGDAFDWIQKSKWVWWMPLVPLALITIFTGWQLWLNYRRLSTRFRTWTLVFFSLLFTVIVSALLSKFYYDIGYLSNLLTVTGLLGGALYTLQSKWLFSGVAPIVCIYATIFFAAPLFVTLFSLNSTSEILIPMFISSVICTYVVLEMYYMRQEMTEEDCILTNISFYIDFAYPMRCLHHVCELTEGVNIAGGFVDDDI
ncbi:hypothetical protein K450DRAFT_218180 [Umbelopsis ramanniana AG]|uniref:Uncharacterized protein n=1 Tax=Umbelopsis ramanniana AG TaxID=1314678 RepID=A0AAD5EIM9_UMBRA|nr:uncharacterized protein K450DRAFT_218180 [Umbelopsis ramanniana AG]KAI8584107.1 hypothetical protein K450DRAFT_218180 [Umbelopsis ramanniana AG]